MHALQWERILRSVKPSRGNFSVWHSWHVYEPEYVIDQIVGHTWHEDGLAISRLLVWLWSQSDTWEPIEHFFGSYVSRYYHDMGTAAQKKLVSTRIE